MLSVVFQFVAEFTVTGRFLVGRALSRTVMGEITRS